MGPLDFHLTDRFARPDTELSYIATGDNVKRLATREVGWASRDVGPHGRHFMDSPELNP